MNHVTAMRDGTDVSAGITSAVVMEDIGIVHGQAIATLLTREFLVTVNALSI